MNSGGIEYEEDGTRAYIISCAFVGRPHGHGEMEESVALARAINLDIVCVERVKIIKARSSTLLGSGKVSELGARFSRERITLAVVDADLSPIQQRNLERAWSVKVLDRTGLILEIFAARARSREGRLQVELARLTYQKTRLVRGWTHLERQRGGLGFVGGPGETQIEADRRLLQQRISRLSRQLENVRRTRREHRKKRNKKDLPLVSLVGYTNCGKSTLFNRLSASNVLARNMLFATLDPTVRGIEMDGVGRFLLSDTVGFIRNLPTDLVMSFRATLEEIVEADILLHVHDASQSDDERCRQGENVEEILRSLGIGEDWGERIVHVYNKMDAADEATRILLENQSRREGNACLISALTGEGFKNLSQLLRGRISRLSRGITLRLEPEEEACRAWLYRHGHIESQERDARGRVHLRVALSSAALGSLFKRFPSVVRRLEEN
ncbi:MAG: GTPase HflX [Hyphomicrobiales bacterium]|nr:GTPase HflX [Hyphomicrobiales bacterium]MCY4048297.1 GTPase HflX [Hyphomicrobiales bacterium]MCY4053846.1 GTPase HflX [Hyphomicrobiales bacterium]